MAFLSNLDVALSGMMAQRLRLDVIAQNVANADTTDIGDGTPYVRQVAVFTEGEGFRNITPENFTFGSLLDKEIDLRTEKQYTGVVVSEIVEDETPPTPVYDPSHPDADEDGYYYMPNVDVQEEQIDSLAATQSYQANLTIFNTIKTLAQKALTIGS